MNPQERPAVTIRTSIDYSHTLDDIHRTRIIVETTANDYSPTNRDRYVFIGADTGKATSMSSVFTLCNSAIGAGVLSLPYAFKCAGALGCLLLCLVLGVMEGSTLYVLAKFAERYNARTYGQLVRANLGRKLSATLSGILVLYLWGSCIAYLIIIGDTFSSLMALHVGGDSLWADRRLIIAALGVVVIFPLCLPRRLEALHWVSAAAVVGFMYTAVAVVVGGVQGVLDREPGRRFEDVRLFRGGQSALFAIPIVVFGYNCHANVVTIFTELELRPRMLVKALPSQPAEYAMLTSTFAPKPKTHKLVGMLGVIISAMQIIMLGYLAVGFTGYLAFPTSAESNILNSFPEGDVLFQVARAVIGCVVVGHYPVNHHPARLAFEDLCAYWLGWRTLTKLFSLSVTIVFVISSCAVAAVVRELGTVLHMIGGTAASFMIFFLPGLMLINDSIMKHSAEQLEGSTQESEAGSGPSTPKSQGMESAPSLRSALLTDASQRGVKSTKAIVFAPRKSWWIGITLMTTSIFIFTITIWTTFT